MAYGRPEIKFGKYKICSVKIEKEKGNYSIKITTNAGLFGSSVAIKDCEDDFEQRAKFWKRLFVLSYGLSPRLIMVDNGYADETVIILNRLGRLGKRFMDHYSGGVIVKEI